MSNIEDEKYWEEMGKEMENLMSMSEEELDKLLGEEARKGKKLHEFYEKHKNDPRVFTMI